MELRILGAQLEGWDDERISACCGVPSGAAAGRYVPPALWP